MQLDHIGIAVKDLAAALELHARRLGGTVLHRERLEHEQVEVAFVDQTELLAPFPGSRNALSRFLEHHGEGLHHIAYRVPDMDRSLAELASKGFTVVPGYPRVGAQGRRVAFLHPKTCGGVLVELCEALKEKA